MTIKKRDSSAILSSLSGGVVPSRGLQHIMVGRAEEARQILKELKDIESGASVTKFFHWAIWLWQNVYPSINTASCLYSP